jgi:hypothetical protein
MGRYFEDFTVGDVYRHELGRTITVYRRSHGPKVADVEPRWDERSSPAGESPPG